jgi:geranylgeranyl pyrophosphate synthase
MDLAAIYAPVRDDLDSLHRLLEEELQADDPFIGDLVRHVLGTRGKMIRPALVCLAAQASGGAGAARLWLAAAVELIHVASLIHDDVIDESAVRRGVATVNVQWGNQIAVLLGDYLFAKAFHLLSRIRHPEVAATLAVATVHMSQAEILQVKYGQEPHDDEAVYLRIIAGKTAHLFAAACRAGGLLAGNGPAADRLGVFGLQWGMAFQITDDALDLTGREAALGKPVYSDIQTGKVTLPLIRTLRQATPQDRDHLLRLLAGPRADGDRDAIRRLVQRYQGIEYALDVAGRYSRQAAQALAPLPPGPAKDSLLALTEFVVVRSH